MVNSNGIHIAAGGESSRLKATIAKMGYPEGYPKHLLPTGAQEGETFLGRIVRQALSADVEGPVVIDSNKSNAPYIMDHPDIDKRAEVVVNEHNGSSLRYMLEKLVKTGRRVLGCAGDFYADINWRTIINWHESRDYPITFATGRTVAVEQGAAFQLSESLKITQLSRTIKTSESDAINIGVYVFDPQKDVLRILSDLVEKRSTIKLKDDVVAHRLIEGGLVGAYMVPGTPFNVNTPETYSAVLEHTVSKQII